MDFKNVLDAHAYSGDKVSVTLKDNQIYEGVVEEEDEDYAIYRDNESKVNGEGAISPQFTAEDVMSIRRVKESMISNLLKLADKLDQKGFMKEANIIDKVVKAMDFTGLNVVITPDKELDDRELCRALRMSIAAEHDATHFYELIADATTNPKVKEVMQDVANEEKVHVGEFEKLLQEIDKTNEGFVEEGKQEVERGEMESERTTEAKQYEIKQYRPKKYNPKKYKSKRPEPYIKK